MKFNKKISFMLLLVVLSMLLGACGTAVQVPTQAAGTAQAGNSGGSEPFKLNVSLSPYMSNTVLLIAQKNGYFAEQNLDVTFTQFQNNSDVTALLSAGKLDIGAPSANAALFNAVAKNGNIKVILPLSDLILQPSCTYVAYIARTADIKSGVYTKKSDWAKARIYSGPQGLVGFGGYLLSKVLDNTGVGLDSLNIQKIDTAVLEDALRKGQVDIAYAVEPSITRMTASGDLGVLAPAEPFVPKFPASMIVAGKRVLDNPDVARRFSIAYLKAVRQFLKGAADDGNVATAVELTKLTPDLVKKVCWPSVNADGVVNVQALMDYQTWLVGRKLQDQVIPADKFYDPSFAAAALQVLGPQKP